MKFGKKDIERKQGSLSQPKGTLQNWISVVLLRVIFVIIVGAIILGLVNIGLATRKVTKESPILIPINQNIIYKKTKVLDSNAKITDEFTVDTNQPWLSSKEIPDSIKKAVVYYLDPEFYSRKGVDIKNELISFFNGIFYGKYTSKTSSISERLIENNIFNWKIRNSNRQGMDLRLQKDYLSEQLEKQQTKDEILTQYLNTLNLGEGTYGIQSAAKKYFGKNARDLSLSEISVLVAIIGEPISRDPISNPNKNAKYRNQVLKNMLESGYISEKEYRTAYYDNVYSRVLTASGWQSEAKISDFSKALRTDVIKELQNKYNYNEEQAYNLLYRGGLTIYSTQDSAIQSAAQKAVANSSYYHGSTKVGLVYSLSAEKKNGEIVSYNEFDLGTFLAKGKKTFSIQFNSKEEAENAVAEFRDYIWKKGYKIKGEKISYPLTPEVSLTVMSQFTGEIKAMIGEHTLDSQTTSSVNRATSKRHETGGVSDVLTVYAPALDSEGFTLSSSKESMELLTKGKRKKGVDLSRVITLRKAIETTSEKNANWFYKQITNEVQLDAIKNYKFSSPSMHSLNEGNIALSSLEMVSAYAAIAANGSYTEPMYYAKVIGSDGRVLLDKKTSSISTMKDTTAYLLTKAMESSVTSGSAKQGALSNMTTAAQSAVNDTKTDAWYVGYSPYYTCAVWGGTDDETKMQTTDFVPEIWKAVMKKAHKGLVNKNFTRPDGIVERTLSWESGKLAITGVCPHIYNEYFTEGTEPTGKCDYYGVALICRKTGKLATPDCKNVEKRVYIKGSEEEKKLFGQK